MDLGLSDSIWDTKLNYTITRSLLIKVLVYLDQLALNPMLSYTAVMSPVCPGCVLTFTLLYTYICFYTLVNFFTAVTPDISRDTRVYLKVHVSYYLI